MLTWTNINTNLYYSVQWLPAMTGSNNWAGSFRGCQDLRSSDPTITVPVPVFYRVAGTSNPVYTRAVSPDSVLLGAGYYTDTALDVVETDLAAENIKMNVVLFGITGTYEGGGGGGGGPPAPVRRTGQTTSYRTGDDGDLEPGVAWPNPRFTINTLPVTDDTVTDHLTGLIWRRIANMAGEVDWNTAIDRCNASTDGGHTDWRLSTITELNSLIDYRYQYPPLCNTAGTGQWANADPFYSVQDTKSYWTSTSRGPVPTNKWAVNMGTGIPGYGYYAYVWPVRGPD